MKKLSILCSGVAISVLIACSGGANEPSDTAATGGGNKPESMVKTSDYDPDRGEGIWNNSNIL